MKTNPMTSSRRTRAMMTITLLNYKTNFMKEIKFHFVIPTSIPAQMGMVTTIGFNLDQIMNIVSLSPRVGTSKICKNHLYLQIRIRVVN